MLEKIVYIFMMEESEKNVLCNRKWCIVCKKGCLIGLRETNFGKKNKVARLFIRANED